MIRKILIVFILLVSVVSVSNAQYYDSTELSAIHIAKSAAEGDLYLDTIQKNYYLGLTTGELSQFNNDLDSMVVRNDSLFAYQNDSLISVELVKRTPQVLSISGGLIDWDVADGFNASVTLNVATSAIALSNVRAGCYGTLVVTQDATGGRLVTFPVGSKVMHGNAEPLTLTPNAVDILSFYYDGTTYYWTYGNNFD